MDMTNGGRISGIGARTGHTHPASELDAIPLTSFNVKGDLIVGSGNDAYYVLPVGDEGTALTPSPSAPGGVAWSPVAQASHTHTQAQSHFSADTDQSATALHHTLGTGASQAAAGNHTHLDIVPIGAILPYAGGSAPAKYLLCDGSVVSSTAYPTLAAICGTLYGAAPAGQFRLPDLKARVPFGFSSGVAEFNTMGKAGGALTVTLTTSNMPQHSHTVPAHNHSTPSHSHTTQSHSHTVADHSHSTPNHTHTASTDSTGSHGHSVSVSIADSDSHQHDTRISGPTNFVRTGTGGGAAVSTTNTSNLTAAGGVHRHTPTVTQSNAGSHSHALTFTSTGGGTSGTAAVSPGSASVTVDSGGSGTSGSSAEGTSGTAGSGVAASVLNSYVTVQYIIKAL